MGVNRYNIELALYRASSEGPYANNFFVDPHCTPRKRYRQFYIPKKSGGARVISAPHPLLKRVQYVVAEELTGLYAPDACVMGFVPGKSVADNARVHAGRKYVFNADLKDFFPSIGMGRVIRALMQPDFGCSEDLAKDIAGICCMLDPATHRCVLPQGAPSSPILSNIACQGLDRKLGMLARRNNARYTRYADDITFSSNFDIFSEGSLFRKAFEDTVKSEGFRLNANKTRVQPGTERQEVTGITVNKEPNVSKDYIRELRMLIHIIDKYGEAAAYMSYCAKHFGSVKDTDVPVPPIRNIIQGKLAYLCMVKGADDPVYINLAKQFALREHIFDRKPASIVRKYTLKQFEIAFNTRISVCTKVGKVIVVNEPITLPYHQHHFPGPDCVPDLYGICEVNGERQFVWFSLIAALAVCQENDVVRFRHLPLPHADYLIEQIFVDGRSFWRIDIDRNNMEWSKVDVKLYRRRTTSHEFDFKRKEFLLNG